MLQIPKALLKLAAGPAARWLTAGYARILMYHRFSAEPAPRRIHAEAFETQVRYLARHFELVHLSTIVAGLRAERRHQRRLVAITIDDCYADLYTIAYPILKRYNVPATIFVVTDFAAGKLWLWFDAIMHIMQLTTKSRASVFVHGQRLDLVLEADHQRRMAWEIIADSIVAADPLTQYDTVRMLSSEFAVPLPEAPTPEYRSITYDELTTLDPGLIEVGSHTCTHPILTTVTQKRLECELEASKEVLENRLQRRVKAFCYPNGQPGDYDARTDDAVIAAGYECAVVAHGGMARSGTPVFKLCRVPTSPDFLEFRSRVNGTTAL